HAAFSPAWESSRVLFRPGWGGGGWAGRSSPGRGAGGGGRGGRRGDGAPPRPVRPPGPRGGVPGGPAPERRLHRAAGVHAPDIRPARGRRTGPSPLRDGLSPTSLRSAPHHSATSLSSCRVAARTAVPPLLAPPPPSPRPAVRSPPGASRPAPP